MQDIDHISIAVRDLVSWSDAPGQYLPGFPLNWRGSFGRRAQSRIHDLKPSWRQEYAVSGDFRIGQVRFTVSGKIDLLYEGDAEVIIEEVKTVILSRSAFTRLEIGNYPHFIEQLLYYSYLYHLSNPDRCIVPRLTIVNLINDQTSSVDLPFKPAAIRKMIVSRLKVRLTEQTMARRVARKRAKLADRIRFEPPPGRAYQNEMITVIGECLAGGENIMVSAPTGSGKTITTLFPVLGHALRHDKRIFYLTAKNTQQDAVASNLQQLTGAEFPLKTIFLRARGQMCANDLYFCHGDYCSYAADSFNRIRQSGILEQLQAAGTILPQNIYTASTGRSLCPAEVQMALAGRSDLVVGDYNYIFDPAAALQSVFYRKPPGEWILVIDEAHNLYARAMERLSPSVSFNEIDALYRDLESRTARIYKKLADAIRTFRDILAGQYRDAAVYAPDRPVVLADPDGAHWRSAFDHFEQVYLQYLLHRIRYRQVVIDDPVEDFYFRLRYFVQILGTADTAFTPFFSAVNGGTLKIQCCDPSAYLGERIDQFHSVVALSATLEPMNWYRNALGFRKENTRTLQLAYPFSTARRRIIVVPGFDTRVKERHQNYPRYAEIIRNVVSIKPGNYIVFFPSFETLQTTNLFLGGLTATKLIQRSTMTAEEREELIAGLRAGDEPKVLLAVTGGIFAEGIDLPGAACIGVIIFGPSLPAVTPERELVRAYYDRSDEDGFLQAYVYPGMLRVIQAAGRLIRSDQDYGVLVLVGDRLADERFSALFPENWGDLTVTSDYQTPLIRFWQNFRT